MVFLVKTISGKRARDGQVGRPQSTPLNLEMQIVKYAVDMDGCSWVWPHIEEYSFVLLLRMWHPYKGFN